MAEGKVTALVTREVDGRPELCVFDHAGWVQLPAGTIEPGELPLAAAVREAWEETGLPRLEVVARVATLEEGTRAVFHLRATEPVPDEWWVLTPDGNGSQWRCRWIPLADVEGMHDGQRAWIDAMRDLLDTNLPVDRLEPRPEGVLEVFDATLFVRFLTVATESPTLEDRFGWVSGICVTADGDAVIVTRDASRGWGLPGVRPAPEETPTAALARAVATDVGGRVVASEPILRTDDGFLDDSRRVIREHATIAFWARVELDDPPAGIERRLVPLADLADELRWEIPLHLRLHRLAFEREGRA